MTQRTRQELQNDVAQLFPDNTTGQISPADVRSVSGNQNDSFAMRGDGTADLNMILKLDSNGDPVRSSVSDDGNAVMSTVTIGANQSRALIVGNQELRDAFREFIISNLATNESCEVITQNRDVNGWQLIEVNDVPNSAEAMETVFATDTDTLTSPITFTLTAAENRLLLAVMFKPTPAVSGTMDITVRLTNNAGRVLVNHPNLPYTVTGGVATVDLETLLDPKAINSGDTFHFTIDNVNLLGSTAQNTPYHRIRYAPRVKKTLAPLVLMDEGTAVGDNAHSIDFRGATVAVTGADNDKTVTINAISGLTTQDEGTTVGQLGTTFNFVGAGVTVTGANGVKTITIPGVASPPQATHTNYVDVTTDNLAASVGTGASEQFDDLNPTVTLETFTGNRYVQILQSMAHTRFTSLTIGGINQLSAFTITDNAREIGGQQYRQYVSTNQLTDAFSGATLVLGGAV